MSLPTNDPDLAQPEDADHAPPPGGPAAGYADHHHPLGGYAALAATFGTLLAGGLVALERSGRPLPERGLSSRDLVLAGIATHKLTRLISRDRVTQFARAPFTQFQDDAGQGEVDEQARGTGLRRAIGELVVCDYCLAQWVAGAFAVGLVGAPRPTRLVAGMYTVEALSDALNVAYSKATS